jgi:hypothetical protein
MARHGTYRSCLVQAMVSHPMTPDHSTHGRADILIFRRFTGRYHTMVVFLHRPCPQIPKPSPEASQRCYDSCAFLLELFSQQVKKSAVDVTWVLLLTIYMSLNTILWSISYKEVRDAHPRQELDELVNKALVMIDQCAERWPGVESVSQLYSVFATACLQSYDAKPEKQPKPLAGHLALDTPPSLADTDSPSASDLSGNTNSNPHQAQSQTRPDPPLFNAPQFGYVFDAAPEPIPVDFAFDGNSPFQNNSQPAFRSNSIFMNPASSDSNGRRFSYFPPELNHHPGEAPLMDPSSEGATPAAEATPYSSHASPPIGTPASNPPSIHTLPTPPASLASMQAATSSLSPPLHMAGSSPGFAGMQPQASPRMMPVQQSPAVAAGLPYKPDGGIQPNTLDPQHLTAVPQPMGSALSSAAPSPSHPATPQLPERAPRFTIPPPPTTSNIEQRPLPAPPTTVADWYRPPAPLISPYAFSSGAMTGNFWGDNASTAAAVGSAFPEVGAAGAANMMAHGAPGNPFAIPGMNGANTSNPVDWANMSNLAMSQFSLPGFERHASLTQEQQMELMGVLESQGMGEMDALLMGLGDNLANNMASGPTTGAVLSNGISQNQGTGATMPVNGQPGNGGERWS